MWQNNLGGAAQLRNVNFLRLDEHNEVEFGFDLKYEMDDYDYRVSDYTNYFGDTIPGRTVDYEINSPKGGGFASYIVRLGNRITATLGLRYDYSLMTQRSL